MNKIDLSKSHNYIYNSLPEEQRRTKKSQLSDLLGGDQFFSQFFDCVITYIII
jgi:hypothetical protein